MKVILTTPFLPKHQRLSMTLPHGLLYIASYARRHMDLDVKIFDSYLCEGTFDEFVDSITSVKPDIVGIEFYSHHRRPADRLITALKEKLPEAIILLGGSHVNAVKEVSLRQFPKVDYAISGEGEKGFLEFCKQFQTHQRIVTPETVPGLAWRNGSSTNTVPNAFSENIDDYDPLDFNLININDYFAKGSPMGLFRRGKNVAQIITTRGCPFPCKFCASPINMGRRVRKRSTDNIIKEIKTLVRLGADEIHIMDDNFTFHKDHAMNLCKTIKSRFKIHIAMSNGVRLDRLDEELLIAMKEAGMYYLGFGVEAGSDEALKAIRKAMYLDAMKEKIALVKKVGGFTMAGFFILGFPFDTFESMRETAATPDRLGLDMASFGNFTPLPATRMFNELLEKGEIDGDYLPSFASGEVTYSPPGITHEQLAKFHRNVVFKYWIHPKRIKLVLSRLTYKDLIFVFRRLYQIILRPQQA